ncbi:HSF-type DNA-binding-domain-containing protein [Chaetomium tenue]|uniref:HSF-type DNA-binding-domain-containing protein n=1 Tax=Chaetomium tenue TaxID=1854479 RepID=A0ACB7PLD5_9PEZI|nr:HSF-type DNA-binding-domain-containing protein [Chaetomium globosum]
MLEDPTYNSVVRWNAEGDSFVVLENEKFTKTILPKHFKHSNFASFVRQLNKYDFHKVRHNEESGEPPYGRDAWEFRHPEFRADGKDNLDNIRRKAPAQRKAPSADDAFPASQQIVVLSESLTATQHQIQALQEQYFELEKTNRLLVSEVLSLQKMVRAQSQASNELITHLNNVEDRRRNSRHSAQSSHSGQAGQNFHAGAMSFLPDGADEPAPELRRAREILNGVSPDVQADKELERLSMAYNQNGSPADSAGSSVMFAPPGAGIPMVDPLNDPRHMVYPVGQTTGIDPFHADHINNIPYSRPLSNPNMQVEAPSQTTPPLKENMWHGKKPHILLVEDDKTCARIGSKFLTSMGCTVDTAGDGLSAIQSVNQSAERFDLIFMDIIMPRMDGVSATAMIRMVVPQVPMVAMTSNIRQEDIATYFQFGMNDVLAKPFTREGMARILRKHLPSMLKDPQPAGGVVGGDDLSQTVAGGHGTPHQGGFGPAAMGGMPQVKFENTPLQSPSTVSSWHSPSQMHQNAPNLDGTPGGYMNAVGSGPGGMVLTPGGSQRPPPQTQHHPHHQLPHQQGGYPGYMMSQQVTGPQAAQVAQAAQAQVVQTAQAQAAHAQAQAQAMRGMAENARMAGMQVAGNTAEERPEKRQRLYGPVAGQGAGGGYGQQ